MPRKAIHKWDIHRLDKLICNLYWHQKVCLRTEDRLSPEIHIKRGVRQCCVQSGCVLSVTKTSVTITPARDIAQVIELGEVLHAELVSTARE